MAPPFDWAAHDLTSAEGARAWLEHLKLFIADTFRANGKWTHMAVYLDQRDPKTRLRWAKVRIFTELMGALDDVDRETQQDAFTGRLRQRAARGDSVGVAMTAESWTLRAYETDEENHAMARDYQRNWLGRMADHPRAVEVVAVIVEHRALGSGILKGVIKRDGPTSAVITDWAEEWTGPGVEAKGVYTNILPQGRE